MNKERKDGRIEDVAYHCFSGVGDGPALILLHGFLGSSASWRRVVAALENGRRIIALEVPGHHRDSPIFVDDDFTSVSARLHRAIRALCDGPVDLAGYSLGGRLALGICAVEERGPADIRSLTLIGTRPGLASPKARRARRIADRARARALRDGGLAAFVEAWEALPLFQSQHALGREILDEQRRIRLAHDAHALALCLEKLSPAQMPDFSERVAEWTFPLRVLVGEADEGFVLPSRLLASRSPHGKLVTVAGCGHNLLLENPESVAALLSETTSGHDESKESAP